MEAGDTGQSSLKNKYNWTYLKIPQTGQTVFVRCRTKIPDTRTDRLLQKNLKQCLNKKPGTTGNATPPRLSALRDNKTGQPDVPRILRYNRSLSRKTASPTAVFNRCKDGMCSEVGRRQYDLHGRNRPGHVVTMDGAPRPAAATWPAADGDDAGWRRWLRRLRRGADPPSAAARTSSTAPSA